MAVAKGKSGKGDDRDGTIPDSHFVFEIQPYALTVTMGEVATELTRSCIKHPLYPKDPQRMFLILGEEYGEANKDLVEFTREFDSGGPITEEERANHRLNLEKELVQTAAMAVKMLIAIRMMRYKEVMGDAVVR